MVAVEAFTGPSPSGKTSALLARVARLLEEGVSAHDIMVVTAGRDAASAFVRRLSASMRADERCEQVRFMSARALSWSVLCQPESCRHTGIPARVMLDVERSLVMFDLREMGLDKGRVDALRADLASLWDQGLLPGDACSDDASLYLRLLRDYGAYDLCEVGARALDCARSLPLVESRLSARHVFVDDANFIGIAQLRLASALCTEQLVIAGDPSVANPFFDSSARGTSYSRFLKEMGVVPSQLELPSCKVSAEQVHLVKCADVAEESVVCAKTVRHVLEGMAEESPEEPVAADGVVAGCSDGLAYPDEVAVVVPRGIWMGRVCKDLRSAGVAVVTCGEAQPISGDPRDVSAAAGLQSFALLGLACDPGDVMSWRAWCAIGRSDVSSRAWSGLRGYAADRGVGLVEALASLSAGAPEPFEGAQILARRYAQGCEVATKARRLTGRHLVDAVDPRSNPSFTGLCEPVVSQKAPELFSRVNLQAVDRGFGGRRWDVRVGVPFAFAGLRIGAAMLLGLAEGVVPRESGASAASQANELALYGGLVARASDSLLLSYPRACDLVFAQRCGACIKRTKRLSSGEAAMLAPSRLVSGLGPQTPSSMSGQQYASWILEDSL